MMLHMVGLGLMLSISIVLPISAFGYDVPTHRALGRQAATVAEIFHERLIEDLAFSRGRDTALRDGVPSNTVRDLVEQGAGDEDRPFWRVRHHFHNPLLPWADAGLRLDANSLPLGMSSVLRGQQIFQEGPAGGGTWSWPFARQRFLAALTVANPGERERAFADTFRALGHVTHFIQDATVPAHVRNDMHLWLPLGGDRFVPVNSDWYEDWVQEILDARSTRQDPRFDKLLALPPKRPLRLVFHSENPEAPSPIAGLIDTDQFVRDGPVPALLGPHTVGVAEVTNANFLSRDTIFEFFSRPNLTDVGDAFVQARADGTFRRYWPKIVRGTSTVEVIHFVAETALAHSLAAVAKTAPPNVVWILDDLVHEDYARQLIPRAVGYSAELLDYFFRGRLAVDLVPDPFDPSVARVVGTNGSPEPLFEGTLTLHADRPTGERGPATPLEPTSVIGVAPGETVVSARFRLPEDAERVVAVYQGTLGLERKREDFTGAVIGKVLGGLRVEEVFADGDRWRLRTPLGVFDLPLATAMFEDVKWGDADNVLVARTALDADPSFVSSYEIVRRPGSIEPLVAGTPPLVEMRALGTASLAFASAPLVTTITLDQTTEHRQQIGRWRQVLALQWVESEFGSAYDVASVTSTPVVFETIHAESVTFAATIPVRLDAEHNLDLGTADEPYYWELVDIGADRRGRILGLAAIYLTDPALAAIEVPWFRLDTSGQPFAAGTVPLRAHFPDDTTTIWALVDLGAGAVVAATSEPQVIMRSRHVSEAPPWDNGGGTESRFPAVYRYAITTFSGGPSSGHVDERVEPPGLARRLTAGGIGARLDASLREQALTVSGWFQPEIQSALARSGLGAFRVGEIARSTSAWNYVCVTSPCSSDSDYLAFEVTLRKGGVVDPPASLVEARRARPAPAGERLVLLGDAFRATSRPVGSVIAWDVESHAAREALRVPDSFHTFGAEASSGAVLLAYTPQVGTRGTFLVPLEEGAAAQFFAGRNLVFDFTVMGGDRLYNVRDFRFYRGAPPLQITPLPARLSPLPLNPIGDYHAIALP